TLVYSHSLSASSLSTTPLLFTPPLPPEIYTLSLHDALPISSDQSISLQPLKGDKQRTCIEAENAFAHLFEPDGNPISVHGFKRQDRKSTRLNSSHGSISYAVFCLKKKKKQ